MWIGGVKQGSQRLNLTALLQIALRIIRAYVLGDFGSRKISLLHGDDWLFKRKLFVQYGPQRWWWGYQRACLEESLQISVTCLTIHEQWITLEWLLQAKRTLSKIRLRAVLAILHELEVKHRFVLIYHWTQSDSKFFQCLIRLIKPFFGCLF